MTDIPDYPGNSNSEKEDAPKPKVDKVIEGAVHEQKPSLGKRIAQSFVGDDKQSVGSYILFDVLIPAAKATISDAVSQGIERMLFGTVRGTSVPNSSTSRGTYTSYGSRSNRQENTRELPARARATHNFDNIVLETRGEAENVIQTLLNLVEDYGFASVSDLYSAIGLTGSFTDDAWGWTNLNGATMRRVRNGFLLELPRPRPAD